MMRAKTAPKKRNGFTLPELMVAFLIFGILMAIITRFFHHITLFSVSHASNLALESDATALFTIMSQNMEKAGAGVFNHPNSNGLGNSLIARPALLDNPAVIFFYTDYHQTSCPVPGGGSTPSSIGDVDGCDDWMRYKLNNSGQITEEMFTWTQNGSWNDIYQYDSGNTTQAMLGSCRTLPMNPGVSASTLTFTLYTSRDPPQPTQDSGTATYVKISMTLKKGPDMLQETHWVFLRNIVLGRMGS